MQHKLLIVSIVALVITHMVKTDDCSTVKATVVSDSSKTTAVKTEDSTIVVSEETKHEEVKSDVEGSVKLESTETKIQEIGATCDEVKVEEVTNTDDGEKHEKLEIDSINGVKTGEKHEVTYESSDKSSAESSTPVSEETLIEKTTDKNSKSPKITEVVADSAKTIAVKTEDSTKIVSEETKHEEVKSDAESTVKVESTETKIPEIDATCDQVKVEEVTKTDEGKKHEKLEIDAINGVKTEEKHEVSVESSSKISTKSSEKTETEESTESNRECRSVEATVVADSAKIAAVETEGCANIVSEEKKHEEVKSDVESTVKLESTETKIPEIDVTCDEIKVEEVTKTDGGTKDEKLEIDAVNGVKTAEKHEVSVESSAESSAETSAQVSEETVTDKLAESIINNPTIKATVVTDSEKTTAVEKEGSTEIVSEETKHEEVKSDAESTVKLESTETKIPEIGATCDEVKVEAVSKTDDGKKDEKLEIDAVNGVKTAEKHEVSVESSSESTTKNSEKVSEAKVTKEEQKTEGKDDSDEESKPKPWWEDICDNMFGKKQNKAAQVNKATAAKEKQKKEGKGDSDEDESKPWWDDMWENITGQKTKKPAKVSKSTETSCE